MATAEIRYPEFGKRFSRLMDDKGWTTSRLAAIAGPDSTPVTFATIARLRNGNTRPRPALLSRLAELLEVSADVLIGNDAPASRMIHGDFRKPEVQKHMAKPTIAQPSTTPPAQDTLEWRMNRIVAIKKQIADADALKPELATLIEQVGSELTRLKYLTEPSP